MSEDKFTSGNWEVSDCGLIVTSSGFKVARAHSGSNIPIVVQSQANAHLIAAAPKMYKFIESLQLDVSKDIEAERLLAEARGEYE